jgi:putative photosynthetic complex assembly protein
MDVRRIEARDARDDRNVVAQPRDGQFPRWFLWSVGAMMVFAMAFAGLGRIERERAGPPVLAPVAEQITILFDERIDGSVEILRESDRTLLDRLPSDGSGFLRGVFRSLKRDRVIRSIPQGEPYLLVRRTNGRVSIVDAVSGERINLNGFGPTNLATANRVLDAGLAADPSQPERAASRL